MNKHEKWFEKTTNKASVLRAAQLSGLSHVTLGRKIEGGRLTPGDVISLARAFGKNPVPELAKLGFITAGEIAELNDMTSLHLATDREIADEVWNRMVHGTAGTALRGPLTSPVEDFKALSVVPDIKAAKRKDGRRASVEGAEGSTP